MKPGEEDKPDEEAINKDGSDFGWKVKMSHVFPETWDGNIRIRLKQIPDLLPLFIRYFFWWVSTWLFRGVKPFIDLYMMTGKNIYGVPIGGIGSGTIGRGFKGQFCRFQMTPGLYTYNVCHADQFILSVRDAKGKLSYQKVLSGAGNPGTLKSWDWTFNPDNASYRGLYPRAWYTYNIPEQDLVLECTQISPVIPHNYEDSCMPTAAFVWNVRNNSDEVKQVSIAFTFKNGCGEKSDSNQVCASETFSWPLGEGSSIKGVALENELAGLGLTYGIGCVQKDNYNTVSVMSKFDVETGSDLWNKLKQQGRLELEKTSQSFKKGNLGIAVCSTAELAAKSEKKMEFSLAWHQPYIKFKRGSREFTRRYVRFLTKMLEAVHGSEKLELRPTTTSIKCLTKYCLTNYHRWNQKISEWQNPVLNDPLLPSWFKSAIFNETYFVSDGGTLWVEYDDSIPRSVQSKTDVREEYGRFAYLEAHEYRMYNTYDVHFYASYALASLWPKLELSLQYDVADVAKHSDETIRTYLFDGKRAFRKTRDSVAHDVGDPSEDPFIKLNSYLVHDVAQWRDLNLKFVLNTYRDYVFTSDKVFLRDMFPICSAVMKKCLEWDTDGDGMIENSASADQTYDTWIMEGVSAYCGGLWLAALCSMTKMLEELDMDDVHRHAEIKFYEDILQRAKKSYHDKLWTGEYYKFDSSNTAKSNSIMADQLCGYWALAMCGLNCDEIFPRNNVRTALQTLYHMNVHQFAQAKLGAVNGMTPEGTVDYFTLQSEEVWTGVTYALAASMIHNGMVSEGFKTAEGIYRTVYETIGMGYETPEALYITKKYRAIGYMRPLSIWSILHAWQQRSASESTKLPSKSKLAEDLPVDF